MKILLRLLAVILIIGALVYGTFTVLDDMYLPDRIYLLESESFNYAEGLLTIKTNTEQLSQASTQPGGSYNAKLYFLGMIPLKTVRVSTVDTTYLIPGGMTFGVKMFTTGVIVVGMGDIYTVGGAVCPAKSAGLELGDILVRIDGKTVTSNEDMAAIVQASEGRAMQVVYMREGTHRTTQMIAASAKDGTGYKAGMWVRDSSAGIGTVTYINPETDMMAGLGHGVTDSETGVVLPVGSGELVPVTVNGIVKGQVGSPGELKGAFGSRVPLAVLDYNCEAGVFGSVMYSFYKNEPLQVAFKQQVKAGPAYILCSIDGEGPRYYEAEIESVNLSDASPTKNIVIRITDSELIAATGGIVQGMSGSPIVQNGKIVGAVTHVFVNDPTKGYGIFIENMLFHEKQAVTLKNNLVA
jgi:stage IV sporulation protein B